MRTLIVALVLTTAAGGRAGAQRMDSLLSEGLRLRGAQQLDSASAAYAEAMRLDASNPEPWIGMGWVEMVRGDYRRAVEWFERARRVSTSPGLDISLGQAYMNLAGRSRLRRVLYARRAREAYDRALAADSSEVHALEPLIRWHLAVPRLFGGNPATARRLAERLRVIHPLGGRIALAEIAESEGDRESAGRHHAAAVAEFPDSATAWVAYGGMLERDHRFGEAAEVLGRCVARLPGDAACRYQLGKNLALEGRDPRRAIIVLGEYLDGLPEHAAAKRAAAYYYLGVAHERLGDRDRARELFRLAAELDPDGTRERDRLRRR